jgi:hypothetical protein
MGLFSKKKKELDIDLPPPPPVSKTNMISEESNPDELDLIPKNTEDIDVIKKPEELPDFPNLHDFKEELPPVPDIEELQKNLPPIRPLRKEEPPKFEFPQLVSEEELNPHQEQMHSSEEVEQISKTSPFFIDASSYKDSLSNINNIKSKIKESEEAIKKLNEIKNLKDKYFEDLRAKLEDLQRKSAYIDKCLFEGGALNE